MTEPQVAYRIDGSRAPSERQEHQFSSQDRKRQVMMPQSFRH